MKWYKSAFADITLKWVGESSVDYSFYTIPAFTMVCDQNKEKIYTLLGNTSVDNSITINSQKLYLDGTLLTFKAIQGVAIKYDINGDTKINTNYLDSNNRIYFKTSSIAQNGIFITNVGKNNYSDWVQKDNLTYEAYGNRYYKFGVSTDNSCYLEFPEDSEDVFDEGIEITYINTEGSNGTIPASYIEQFYNDLKPVENGSIILNATNVWINNYSSSSIGEDPESIDDAYKNYTHTVGTFDTLITLRDYFNAIVRSGLVSNAFICDRSNDIQQTYKIISSLNDIDYTVTCVEKLSETARVTIPTDVTIQGKDENDQLVTITPTAGQTIDHTEQKVSLNAFNLKLYLLTAVDDPTILTEYNKTFEMIPSSKQEAVKLYIQDLKSIQHDYSTIVPATTEKSHFCYFINKYPISCDIITRDNLEPVEASELKDVVRKALLYNFNASKIDFGYEVLWTDVKNIILASDDRIKEVHLENLNFTTDAIYWDGSRFQQCSINTPDITPITYTCIYSNGEQCRLPIEINEKLFTEKHGYGDYSSVLFCYTNNGTWDIIDEEGTTLESDVDLTTYGIDIIPNDYKTTKLYDVGDYVKHSSKTYLCVIPKSTPGNWDSSYWEEILLLPGVKLQVLPSRSTQFRDEIYTKSILAGTTQLFVKDEEFDYNLSQVFNKVNSTFNIFNAQEKYECVLNNTISANTLHELTAGEVIIFYYKNPGDTLYNYKTYGPGNAVKASFNLTSSDEFVGTVLSQNLRNIGTLQHPIFVKNNFTDGNISPALNSMVDNISTRIAADNSVEISLENSDYKISNIDKIYANTAITISNGEDLNTGTYTLRDNENIQFYAPNLVSDITYSDNVKYEYFISTAIDMNTVYELKQNEYIILYWKESQDDDIYAYQVYGKGNIIKPSFALAAKTGQGDIEGISLTHNLRNIGTDLHEILVGNSEVDRLMNYSISDAIALKTGKEFILSGNKKIERLKVNEVNLSANNYYCYWILNNRNKTTSDTSYVLFNKGTEQSTLNTPETYILDSGEYFIYANQTLTSMVILGAGTQITRNKRTTVWKVPAIDGSKILSDGLDALKDNWFVMAPDESVKLVENQFINIGSGCIVKFNLQDEGELYTFSIVKPEYLTVSIDKSVWAGSSLPTEVEFIFDGTNWTYESEIVYLADYGVSVLGTPVQDDSITIEATKASSWQVVLNSGLNASVPDYQGISLKSFQISYKLMEDEPYVDLEHLNLTEYTGWHARSLLLIDVSKNNELVLLNGQTLYYHLIDNVDKYGNAVWNAINGADKVDDYYPVVLLSSSDTNASGGEIIYTYSVDAAGIYSYLNLYQFKKYITNTTKKVQYVSDGSIAITLEPIDDPDTFVSQTINFYLPSGEYILPFTNSHDTQGIKIELDGEPLGAIFDSSIIDFEENRRWSIYFKLDTSNFSNEHVLTVSAKGFTNELVISLDNCYKYIHPDNVDEFTFNKLKYLVGKLDEENHYYNYTYQVPENLTIKDPCEAKSFFKSNHIYNSFTICKIDTTSLNNINILEVK